MVEVARIDRGDSPQTKKNAPIRKNGSFHYLRYVILLLSGIAVGLMMMMRLSVTIAMIGMMNHTQIYIDEHPNATAQEVKDNFRPDYSESGEFNWNHQTQETIITCYMITYSIFPLLATRAVVKFGLRISIVTLLSICAVINFLIPIMAYWSWEWLVILRLILGAASSGVVPGMVRLIELWTPSKESATGVVIHQFTSNIICVLTPLFSGQLARIDWRLVFYVPGIATLIFCLLWWIIVSDTPESSGLLSHKELEHITEVASSEPGTLVDEKQPKNDKNSNLGLLFMFKIKEFWFMAFIWCLYCATSGSMVYLLPPYLHSVLKVPVQDVGMYTFIVQLGCLFSMLWPNTAANLFMSWFKCSLTTARRIVVLICIFIATSTILYLAAYHQFVVVLICVHRFFHMTHDTVFLGTIMSNFGPSGTSGLVYSVVNSFGCINSTVFCIIVGKFLDYTGGAIECWSWAFVTMAIMNIVYLLVYCLFCHSEPVQIKTKPKGDGAAVS